MPRKKYSPIGDIYLAAKIEGLARQLNVEALEKYLDGSSSDLFSYKEQLRRIVDFAKAVKHPQ